jgi:type IV secretory pathway TraG/TraD family ATPase VirD4
MIDWEKEYLPTQANTVFFTFLGLGLIIALFVGFLYGVFAIDKYIYHYTTIHFDKLSSPVLLFINFIFNKFANSVMPFYPDYLPYNALSFANKYELSFTFYTIFVLNLLLISVFSYYYFTYAFRGILYRWVKGGMVRYADSRKAQKELKKDYGDVELEFDSGLFLTDDRLTKHMIVVGGTGSGKTAGYFWPILEEINEFENCKTIIHDVKADFTEKKKSRGQRISKKEEKNHVYKNEYTEYLDRDFMLIAPWDERSAQWNVAKDCRTKEEAQQLADTFIEKSDNPMWSNGAKALLVGFIVKLQKEKDINWNWQDIVDQLSQPIKNWHPIMKKYNSLAAGLVEDPTSKTALSYVSTLLSYVQIFEQLAWAWPNSQDGISIKDFVSDDNTGNQILILQNNQTYRTIVQSIYPCMIELLSNYLNSPAFGDSKDRRIYFLLDEVYQLGKIDKIGTILETGRSKGLRAVLAMQDIHQLYDLYGQEKAKSWINMVGSYAICGISGETAEFFADKIIGKTEILKQNYTEEDGKIKLGNREEQEKYIVNPNELNSELGIDEKGYGPKSIFKLDGYRNVYFCHQPFVKTKKQRQGSIQADWVKPDSQKKIREKAEQIKEQAEKIENGQQKSANEQMAEQQAKGQDQGQGQGQDQGQQNMSVNYKDLYAKLNNTYKQKLQKKQTSQEIEKRSFEKALKASKKTELGKDRVKQKKAAHSQDMKQKTKSNKDLSRKREKKKTAKKAAEEGAGQILQNVLFETDGLRGELMAEIATQGMLTGVKIGIKSVRCIGKIATGEPKRKVAKQEKEDDGPSIADPFF